MTRNKLSDAEAKLLLNSINGIHVYDGSPMRNDASILSERNFVHLDGSERGGDHVYVTCTDEGLKYILEALTK